MTATTQLNPQNHQFTKIRKVPVTVLVIQKLQNQYSLSERERGTGTNCHMFKPRLTGTKTVLVYQGAFNIKIDHKISHNNNFKHPHATKAHKAEHTTDRAKITKEEHRVLGFTRTRAKRAAEAIGHKAASERGVSGFVKNRASPPQEIRLLPPPQTRHRFTRKGKKEDLFLPVRQKKMGLLLNT
jgi:hypothetical protein